MVVATLRLGAIGHWSSPVLRQFVGTKFQMAVRKAAVAPHRGVPDICHRRHRADGLSMGFIYLLLSILWVWWVRRTGCVQAGKTDEL